MALRSELPSIVSRSLGSPRRVRLDRLGKIISGPDCGRYVFVKDDAFHVGRYLIILASGQYLEESRDTWIESRTALERHFVAASWEVDWME